MVDRITLRRIDDFHVHLRQGEILKMVLRILVRYASRAVIMPNLRPRAILTADDVVWYRDEILRALDEIPDHPPFEPLMTIEVRDNTTPRMIDKAFQAGAFAGKGYF